jgi:formylglycine-generating enzyme required for sulfatase activity
VKYGKCTVPVDQTEIKDERKKNYPVVNVTLFQANTYCQWLGQRLPKREEWERAARGPNGTAWPWGNEDPTPQTANMRWNEFVPTELVPMDGNPEGKSPEGIYNLIGNAWEWTSSFTEKTDLSDPSRFWNGEPETYNGTAFYVQRGGGWESGIPDVAVGRNDLGTSAYRELGIRCADDVK